MDIGDPGHVGQVRAKACDCELMVAGGVLVIRRGVLWGGVPPESESIAASRIVSISTKAASSVTRGQVQFHLVDGRQVSVEFRRRQRHDVERIISAVNQAAASAPPQPGGVVMDPQVSAGRAPDRSEGSESAGPA